VFSGLRSRERSRSHRLVASRRGSRGEVDPAAKEPRWRGPSSRCGNHRRRAKGVIVRLAEMSIDGTVGCNPAHRVRMATYLPRLSLGRGHRNRSVVDAIGELPMDPRIRTHFMSTDDVLDQCSEPYRGSVGKSSVVRRRRIGANRRGSHVLRS